MFDPAIIHYQIRDAVIYWLLIPATVILSGTGLDLLFDLPPIPSSPFLTILAALLMVGGILFIWMSMQDLTKAGGTPNPLRPPRKIVTTGSYALCRHPMFLGYDLCALSVIFFCRSPGMLCISFPIFLFFEIRFLRREEKILLLKFKDSYAAFQNKTSFLVPFSFLMQICRRQNQNK